MTVDAAPPHDAVLLAQSWLTTEPLQALANFTWVNNVTLGAPYCQFAFDDDGHYLTRHWGLPFAAIAVQGENPARVRTLAAELVEPDQPIYTLAPAAICQVLQEAVTIESARAEWQMLYRGDSGQLDPGAARRLTQRDYPAMLALSQLDEVMVFDADTFTRGEFFGVFSGDDLVAMGGVQTKLAGLCEIGSIVTHPAYRRRGYGSQIVSALIQHLEKSEQKPFLCLFKTNQAAFSLYESLRFEVINELSLLRWRLP